MFLRELFISSAENQSLGLATTFWRRPDFVKITIFSPSRRESPTCTVLLSSYFTYGFRDLLKVSVTTLVLGA